MSYFKINDVDFSHCVNELNINSVVNYNAQTNAAGNMVVDYINTKRNIEVGIIPLTNEAMIELQSALQAFGVNLSFRDPTTGTLTENIACIVPENGVSYYTIQTNKVLFNGFKIKFVEL